MYKTRRYNILNINKNPYKTQLEILIAAHRGHDFDIKTLPNESPCA